MSHFSVLVIGEDVEKQLAPYHEYECTGIKDEYVKWVAPNETPEELQEKYEEYKDDYESYEEYMRDWHGYEKNDEGEYGRWTNPNAKWDWYLVGGRWTGFFRLKEGSNGEHGKPGIMTPDAPKGTADVALKKDIDFESMREEAGIRAARRWDLVYKYIKDTPEHIPWKTLVDKYNKDGTFDRDACRAEYGAQPRVKAMEKACKENRDTLGFLADAEEYSVDRESYIESAKNNAISTYAIVKDSEWIGKGDMGWFGMSHNDMESDEWSKNFYELLESLPEDTLLTVVDCHI